MLNSLACPSARRRTLDSNNDRVFSRISISVDSARDSLFQQKKLFFAKNIFCLCFREGEKLDAIPTTGNFKKRWRLELENTAYLVLSEAPDRNVRLQQKISGVKKLLKLVKKMQKEADMLTDEDVTLLIRCCLHGKHYFAQKMINGEYLLRSTHSYADQCFLESISTLPYHQNQILNLSVLRFLHEYDRWNSCDFAVKVLRLLMETRGKKFVKNVEGEILLTFIAQMVPHCPGLRIPIPAIQTGASAMNTFLGASSFDQINIIERINHILEMARVLHGVLSNFQFRDFGDDIWVAFDVLIRIYINVVHTVSSGKQNEEDTKSGLFSTKRESKEWDLTESALRVCVKNFVDDVLLSKLGSDPFKKPKVNYPFTVEESDILGTDTYFRFKEKANNSLELWAEWDNISHVLILVLNRAISSKVSSEAQYQLLDVIITCTRIPAGYRSLRACLPEKLVFILLQEAKNEDTGVSLRSAKLFQHLLDRHALRFYVLTPRIFKDDTQFSRIQKHGEDLEYFRLHREDIYDTIYKTFLIHSDSLVCLEALFCLVCLILLELQFPLIARDIAELMINIQDAIITRPDLPIQSPRVSAWVHSTVASILSFIASVFGLIELEALVSVIVNRRSEVAPFLIPPLKARHTMGDITDFKEDLFFSHASVRRCLTNACFENSKGKIENERASVSSSS